MKKVKRMRTACLFICLVAVIAIFAALFTDGKTASADTENDAPRPTGQTYVEAYDVTADVNTNRMLKITEDITIYFYNNAGFIRDIPVNAGETVKNVKVREIKDGRQSPVLYSVSGYKDDNMNQFVTVDIGDYRKKFQELHTYRIEYDYCLSKAQEGNDLLALTPIGSGWDCPIYNIRVKLILPEGCITDNRTFCSTVDITGYEQKINFTEDVSENGKTTLTTDLIPYIKSHSQVRFDVHFEDGVLSAYFDFTPYICVIVGAVLILVLVGFKFLFFNKNKIIPVLL